MAMANPTRWVRLLSLYRAAKPSPNLIRTLSTSLPPHKPNPIANPHFHPLRRFSSGPVAGDRIIRELLAEAERERQLEMEQNKKAGIEVDELEDDEDFLGVGPLIDKVEKKSKKELESIERGFWEPTDSESDVDERWAPEELTKRHEEMEKKLKRHDELLRNFDQSKTLDEAHNWMTKINKFEDKHLKLPLEYRVIGDMMNRLKESTGKDRFILLQKLNRAVRMIETKEAYDPSDPGNFGIIQHQQVGSPDEVVDNAGFERERAMMRGADMDENDDFDEEKEKEDILLEKINAIEKKIEKKLEELDHTFGKKGRVLEEEIRDLVEERNSLTEHKKRPLYRKGFGVKALDVNRTTKVTKGGQLVKYTALLATGNYNGVVGFAKGRGPNAKVAIQRAHEKCFQNLHYVERYEGHTIAHAIQTKYEKTKIYLWPAPMRNEITAGRTVETVLGLAGFKNVKTKVIGSRNRLNIVKALFKGLNAIETPKDMQEKLGRTVVESYLL